jgi:hypothetical protein
MVRPTSGGQGTGGSEPKRPSPRGESAGEPRDFWEDLLPPPSPFRPDGLQEGSADAIALWKSIARYLEYAARVYQHLWTSCAGWPPPPDPALIRPPLLLQHARRFWQLAGDTKAETERYPRVCLRVRAVVADDDDTVFDVTTTMTGSPEPTPETEILVHPDYMWNSTFHCLHLEDAERLRERIRAAFAYLNRNYPAMATIAGWQRDLFAMTADLLEACERIVSELAELGTSVPVTTPLFHHMFEPTAGEIAQQLIAAVGAFQLAPPAIEVAAPAVFDRTHAELPVERRSTGGTADGEAEPESTSPDQPVAGTDDECIPSADFTTVRWFGTRYEFTKNQAAVVRVLWEQWEKRAGSLSQETIAERVRSDYPGSLRLRDVFKEAKGQHPAWEKMIRKVRSGTFELFPEKPR